MSRVFPGAIGNYLAPATDVIALDITGAQITLAAWVRPAVVGVSHDAIGKGGGGTGTTQYQLGIDVTNKPLCRVNANTSETITALGATSLVANVWAHLAGRKSGTGAGGLAVFLNGILDGSAAPVTAGILDATQVMVVGGKATGTNPFNGRIAEVAIWNAALTDGEIAGLGRGVCPLLVRRANLAGYFPLFGQTPEADLSGNRNSLLTTGTVTNADHAPVGRLATMAA